MVRYDHRKKYSNQKYVGLKKIVVSSEFDKEQLLLAFKYIHDMWGLDTDYMAVNTIAHVYTRPDLIEVQQ